MKKAKAMVEAKISHPLSHHIIIWASYLVMFGVVAFTTYLMLVVGYR